MRVGAVNWAFGRAAASSRGIKKKVVDESPHSEIVVAPYAQRGHVKFADLDLEKKWPKFSLFVRSLGPISLRVGPFPP